MALESLEPRRLEQANASYKFATTACAKLVRTFTFSVHQPPKQVREL
jgi:hypothetical protein